MAKDTTTPPEEPKERREIGWSLPRKPPAAYKAPWANEYSAETAERICEEVASGRALQRILIEEPWAPSIMASRRWMRDHPEFAHGYELALQIRGEAIAAEVVELADASTDHEQTKLQMQGRQWLAPRLNRRYSERTITEVEQKLEVTTTESIDVSHLTLEEIRAAEALLMKTIEGSAMIEDQREDEE